MKGEIVSIVESFMAVVVNTDTYKGKIKKILHYIKIDNEQSSKKLLDVLTCSFQFYYISQ